MSQLQYNRSVCTRIGIGMLCFVISVMLSSICLELLMQQFAPALYESNLVTLIVNDVSTYLVGPLVLYLVIRPLPSLPLPDRPMTPKRMGKLALECIAGMYFFALLTDLVVYGLTALTGNETENILDTTTEDLTIGITFLFMVVIAPICEELIFRHLLLRRLLPLGKEGAVVLSALCFGLFHTNLYQFFYATALGLLFGCIMVKTGRIWHTMALHAMVNFLGSVVVMLLENSDLGSILFAILIYLLMVAGLIILWRDFPNLWPKSPPELQWKRSALTSPGFLAFVVILSGLSVAVIFYV